MTVTDQGFLEGQRMAGCWTSKITTTFGIDRNVIYLDWGHNFMGVYVFQNALSYTHYIDAVMYINYTTRRKKCSVCSYMTSSRYYEGQKSSVFHNALCLCYCFLVKSCNKVAGSECLDFTPNSVQSFYIPLVPSDILRWWFKTILYSI